MSIAEHPPLDIPKLAADRMRRRQIQVSWPLVLRGLEALALVCMGLWLVQSRLALGQAFFFRYSDEDQTLLWHASHDLLQGRIPEPAFYGQSFNSCLEGYLAAPLILVHLLPYCVAVPSVSVFLGLFPFLAMAWVAWRRGRSGLAALALLFPLILPVRYAMLAGMPRGFVTGIAMAIIPCLLLLKARVVQEGSATSRTKWRQPVRYLLIGLLVVVALTLNPNCSLMIAGAFVYAIATRWREAAFWLYSSLGAFVGALYPLVLFVFYFKLHDDYRLYHREEQYDWSASNFQQFWHHLNIPFGDFLPVGLEAAPIVWVLGVTFAAVFFFLLITRRWAAAVTTATTVGFVIWTLGFKRVHEGRDSVFFGYSRMYLAVPVLPVLFLLWGNAGKAAISATSFKAWIERGCLVVFFGFGLFASHRNAQTMPDVVARELENVEVLQLIDVDEARDVAQAVQSAADSQHAHFVLMVGNQKRWTYLLPALTDCQTLFPHYERRTWRLDEECFRRYQRILVMDRALFDRARKGGFAHATVDSESPFIGAFDTGGKSVIHICQELNVDVRAFNVPPKSDVLP